MSLLWRCVCPICSHFFLCSSLLELYCTYGLVLICNIIGWPQDYVLPSIEMSTIQLRVLVCWLGGLLQKFVNS